jgi:hypothetical protein
MSDYINMVYRPKSVQQKPRFLMFCPRLSAGQGQTSTCKLLIAGSVSAPVRWTTVDKGPKNGLFFGQVRTDPGR